MNDLKKNLLIMIGVVIAICFVGRFDYNEGIVYNMDESTYQVLKKKLGDVSTSELVDTYMSDREYWDSLGRLK
jgi:hypothetical protein